MITMEEAKSDLEVTEKDLEHLRAIILHLQAFMAQSYAHPLARESRVSYQQELMVFVAAAYEGQELLKKIHRTLAELGKAVDNG